MTIDQIARLAHDLQDLTNELMGLTPDDEERIVELLEEIEVICMDARRILRAG